jgi:UV DNA damage endonuclease
MRIGYACVNTAVKESASKTFRVASYSEERAIETIASNLRVLRLILQWNLDHDIRYFRISSGTIPLASHPVMTFDWQSHFADELREIGEFINRHEMRTNVHPGQYTLINSNRPEVVEASIHELQYHADLLDLMGLDHTHKIQLHTGGVYGDKPAAADRFVEVYSELDESIRRRLVIENEERHFNLADNLAIHARTGIPLLFDIFHHDLHNTGESLAEALDLVQPTWEGHGPAMLDYSTQDPAKRFGAHTPSIDLEDFAQVLETVHGRDVDVMLEIKDKEQSALTANAFYREWIAQRDDRAVVRS